MPLQPTLPLRTIQSTIVTVFSMMLRLLTILPLFLAGSLCLAESKNSLPEVSADELQTALRVHVIDPYLDLHTGPGRGYPVIYVVEKDEEISVIRRRTTWYLISDRKGKTGWVTRESLARTLSDQDIPVALPDTRHGDFLNHKFRLGFAVGKQENSDLVSGIAGFRLSKRIGAEVEYGQIFAEKYDGYQRSASLIIEPTDRWSFTPFLSVGMGKQDTELKKPQPGKGPSDDFQSLGAGINMYIGFNFVLRGEFRQISLLKDNDTVSNSVWRVGFSSFF